MHLNTKAWIAIIQFGGQHVSNFGITYSNGGHIGFNYTHTSLRLECRLSYNGMDMILKYETLHL